MRINVYNEELTDEFCFVSKTVEKTGKTYYGFRMFLKSAPELHYRLNDDDRFDDDRSAITMWFGTKEKAAQYLNRAFCAAVESFNDAG